MAFDNFPFLKTTLLIYCICMGAYFVSFFPWGTTPAFDIPFIQTGADLRLSGDMVPVANVFGWEIVQAVISILVLVPLAPVYFVSFLTSCYIPPLYAGLIASPLFVFYYMGFAKFILRSG